MLVLKFKVGHRVRLDYPGGEKPIWVCVAGMGRDGVRLAFQANLDVTIAREELLPDHLKYDAEVRVK